MATRIKKTKRGRNEEQHARLHQRRTLTENLFHQIEYLEGKLILQPDHFTSVETFRDFGELVQRTPRAVHNAGLGGVYYAIRQYSPK